MSARAGLSIGCVGVRRTYPTGFQLIVDRLDVRAGTTTVLLGPSGSGKSTLLFILGLLEPADEGQVLLDGRPVMASDRDARRNMAAVLQRPYLIKGSVGQNVAYGLKLRNVPATERQQRVAEALTRVGLSGYESRSAAALSGGESQRASLARALVLEPRVLLLDEPLASLDPVLKQRLAREFARILHEEGITGVWVTHDQDEALAVADDIAVMNQGRITASGPAEQIMGLPTDAWTAGFLGVEPAEPGVISRSAEGLVDIAQGGMCLAAYGEGPVGSNVIFAVRPEDVMLVEPGTAFPVTSARNRIPAVVTSVVLHGTTARVSLEAHGLQLASTVSRAAVRELALAPGVPVLAVFKASAVQWRHAEDASDTP